MQLGQAPSAHPQQTSQLCTIRGTILCDLVSKAFFFFLKWPPLRPAWKGQFRVLSVPASHRSSSTDTQVKGKGTVRAVINDRMATSMITVLMMPRMMRWMMLMVLAPHCTHGCDSLHASAVGAFSPFNPPKNSMRKRQFTPPFFSWGNWGLEKMSDLPKAHINKWPTHGMDPGVWLLILQITQH